MRIAATAPLAAPPVVDLARVVATGAWFAVGGAIVGAVMAGVMRWRGWAWTAGLPQLFVTGPFAWLLGWHVGLGYNACALSVVLIGAYKHYADLRAGGDLAQRARTRRGVTAPFRARYAQRKLRNGQWVTAGGLVIGTTRQGHIIQTPICGRPVNALAVGATGTGKTVLLVLAALAAITRGLGVIFIDPKGDDFVLEQLREAALAAGRRLSVWGSEGGSVYNPYACGTATEIADKVLAAELFTEPHYQRLAQRYLGHVVRALKSAGITVSPASLLEHMDPARLSALARDLPQADANALLAYLETFTAQQERDIAGARDRLAILAECDVGPWLEPDTEGERIDLRDALERGDVILFRLDADRLPLATEMLAAAIVQDLVAISAARQRGQHRPGLVVIDEFSAIAPREVVRLFSRARGAKLTLLLGTQELADLSSVLLGGLRAGAGILDQVLGNIEVLIALRVKSRDVV